MEKTQLKRGLRSGFPGLDLLHLFSLSSTAFAAPLFFVLGAQAEFFVARRSPPSDVIAFTVLVTFLPALFLALLETLVWLLSPALQKGLHCVFVAALVTLICLAFLPLGLPLSVLLGLLFGVAYHRWESTRGFCTRLSPVVLVLPLVFLFGTPVSTLIQGGNYKSDVKVDSKIPVVLLVFDELPLSSMLDPKLDVDDKCFPNFARFQADALWFRNGVAAADDTMRAVPAILTGKRAPRDKPPVLGNYPQNLFTLLAGNYRLAVSENLTSLAPARGIDNVDVSAEDRWRVLVSDTLILYIHRVLPASYTTDLPPIDKGWVNFANELKRPPREQGFLNFLNQLTDPAEPVLYYFHSNFPHYPYSFLPDGREYDSGAEAAVDGLDGKWMWRSSWHALLGYQRHLLQARFADRLLGLALDRMQEVGLYQRALVIVVADHGASYRFGAPFRPASLGSLPGVGPVPLMVKLPGADHPTGVVDRPVTTLDILPTIIDVLDIPATWPLEGHSLLDQSASSTSRKVSSDVMKTGELVPFPDHLGPLRDAVDHKSKVFGPNLEGLYKAGPAFSLIGQPLPAGKTSTLKGSLLWPSLLLDVKLTDRFVPCRLRGFVGYEGPPIPLAIALNGRIAGSTFSVPGVGESSFSLIVDPELLEPGRNEVSLAVMKTDGSFEPVELETQRVYQLQGNQICDDKGQPLPKEDGLDGMVMSMVLEEGGYKVEGWSVFGSGGSGVPPEELVIFQDGRFLLTAPPQPDGTFRLGLPKPVLVSDRRVRVFAVGGRGARELSYQDSYRQRAKLH